MKETVREYWDNKPCGSEGVAYPEGTLEFYEEVSRIRERLVPFVEDFVEFQRWRDKQVLEVGCGLGSDLCEFARAGACVTGIDLSTKSAALARKRLQVYNLLGDAFEADAERLPFREETFDLVYSFGVLHHTPRISQAIREIHRVLKLNGEIRIMLYHRWSIVAVQMYLRFGLFAGRPLRSLADIFASCHESPGTRCFSMAEVKQMFAIFRDVSIQRVITSYDLRYGRGRYLPPWVGKFIPSCVGWNILIRGCK